MGNSIRDEIKNNIKESIKAHISPDIHIDELVCLMTDDVLGMLNMPESFQDLDYYCVENINYPDLSMPG